MTRKKVEKMYIDFYYNLPPLEQEEKWCYIENNTAEKLAGRLGKVRNDK